MNPNPPEPRPDCRACEGEGMVDGIECMACEGSGQEPPYDPHRNGALGWEPCDDDPIEEGDWV